MRRYFVAKVVIAAAVLSAIGGGAASAFTASNTVNTSYAGEGIGVVSGYNVYNIHYTLAASGGSGPTYDNNANISGVSFTLDHAASTVGYILYNSSNVVIGGGQCSASGSTDGWTCTAYPSTNGNGGGWAPVQQVTQLDVIAAN
ncbi:MAG: hypothetical protein ACYCST_17400 [Acidimicrobiales bacterium]